MSEMTINYEAAVEAILFTMGESVSLDKIAEALQLDKRQTRKLMETMIERYESEDRGIRILELDGSYQFATKSELYDVLIPIAQVQKKYTLTDVLMETLSIIAYKQPITRIEIEKIRGVSCEHAINKLIEFDLIRELGRLDAPGRPIIFGTTEEFLRAFGVSSPDDLPSLSAVQVEEFKKQAEEEIYVTP